MKKLDLNRKQYLHIRKMDHQEMAEYLNDVYEKGMRAGQQEAADPFDAAAAMEAIGQIKGIGKGRLVEIYNALIEAGAHMADVSGKTE